MFIYLADRLGAVRWGLRRSHDEVIYVTYVHVSISIANSWLHIYISMALFVGASAAASMG